MTNRLASSFLVIMLAVGCATGTDPRLEQTSLDVYRLDSGDLLRVTVFGQVDLSGDFRVDDNGSIALPLLAPVRARGFTPVEFSQHLAGVLSQRLLRNPAVSVEVTQYRPFFILGEVNQPGQYPYVNGMTVMTAAAIAGGFTYRADTSQVVITRHLGGYLIEGPAAVSLAIMPGDTVHVRERLF